jgi:AbrB family looped-hinge helix DNA binding protein
VKRSLQLSWLKISRSITIKIRKTSEIGKTMNSVAISPKFQVVIPKEIRTALKLVAGQKVRPTLQGNTIVFEPEPNMQAMRGIWKGMDSRVVREKDRV